MRTFVGLLVLGFALAANGASLSSRIVGGLDAPDGKYPYQVALWYDSRFHCGGSIINESFILTAAHCLQNRKAEKMSVQVGSNVLSLNGTHYKAQSLIPNPGYSVSDYSDIGLVRLSKKIIFNDKVQPIALPDVDLATKGTSAVLTGWGRIYVHGPQPNTLQKINLKIYDPLECEARFGASTVKEICTLTKRGEGACNGDSGGPLVAGGYQIGVVSRGVPCAMGMPDIFTRVHAYRIWIRDTMKHY